METKNKKIRNPFPMVGKVFKYEMISTARIFLPMYIILIALSLITGIFVVDANFSETKDFINAVRIIIGILTGVLFFVMFIITISVIEKRFKKSMLGDEAYLSLTLPATVGEHLWGRYFADIIWGIGYIAISIIALFLILIKEWKSFPEDFQRIAEDISNNFQTLPPFFILLFLNAIIFFMLICTFSYMLNSLSTIIGKRKTLSSILIFIVTFFLYANVSNLLFNQEYYRGDIEILKPMSLFAIYNLVFSIIFSLITRFSLTKNFNLE